MPVLHVLILVFWKPFDFCHVIFFWGGPQLISSVFEKRGGGGGGCSWPEYLPMLLYLTNNLDN